jgi:hypothetical protein
MFQAAKRGHIPAFFIHPAGNQVNIVAGLGKQGERAST